MENEEFAEVGGRAVPVGALEDLHAGGPRATRRRLGLRLWSVFRKIPSASLKIECVETGERKNARPFGSGVPALKRVVLSGWNGI
jgi:hypothetical protein